MAIENIFRILKSIVAGKRPTVNPDHAGMPFVNFADKQFGAIDTAGNPVDLLAVRHYSATAKYAAADLVVYNGVIYKAKNAVSPGGWNAIHWSHITVLKLGETPSTAYRGDRGKTAYDISQLVSITKFSTIKAYDSNDFVTRRNNIYRPNNAVVPAGIWDSSKWTLVNERPAITQFKITRSYNKGNKVVYNNTIWFALSDVTAGPWNEEEWQSICVQILAKKISIKIGPTGVFPDINTAIAHYAAYLPIYRKDGVIPNVTLKLEAGLLIRKPIIVSGEDLSWLRIESMQGDTPYIVVAADMLVGATPVPFIQVDAGGTGPFIDFYAKFNRNPVNDKQKGIFCMQGSTLFGIKFGIEKAYQAVLCDNSNISVENIKVADSTIGVTSRNNGSIGANNLYCAGCTRYGANAFSAGNVQIRSLFEGGGTTEVLINLNSGSLLLAETISIIAGSAIKTGVILNNGSRIMATNCILSRSSVSALQCFNGSSFIVRITLDVSAFTGTGAQVTRGARVMAEVLRVRGGAADAATDLSIKYSGEVIVGRKRVGGVNITPGTRTANGYINL